MKATVFRFTSIERDILSGSISFSFDIVFEDGHTETFTEKLILNSQLKALQSETNRDAVDRCLEALHLAMGMSYWKMYCPAKIETSQPISQEQALWWNKVYTHGMGEFFFNNKIDFRGLVSFPFDDSIKNHSVSIPTRESACATIGGGKDSIVAIEMLKAQGMETELFMLNETALQVNVAALTGLPHQSIQRILDPEMVRRSKAGEVMNGHVPITLVYSLTGVLSAILSGRKYVVMSNERSASIGNVEYLGESINHQWSKSEQAEKMIADYVHRNITPDITVYSILRSMSELEVLRRFSLLPKYFHAFSSCNRNFRLEKPLPPREGHAYWCGACPKCAFVFAGLAAFLERDVVLDIFGKNLFDDTELLPLFRELLGIENFKPFECVGTKEETIEAFTMAHERGEWEEIPAMQMFLSTSL